MKKAGENYRAEEKAGKNWELPPLRYGEGRGERGAFLPRPLTQPVSRASCLRIWFAAGSKADTSPRCPGVQNPYVRLRFVQNRLNGLQTIGACTGYPCIGLPVIAACRCLLMRGNGIGSSHIPVHLHQSVNQVLLLGCDALSAVDVEQQRQALIDLLHRHSKVDQLINMVV